MSGKDWIEKCQVNEVALDAWLSNLQDCPPPFDESSWIEISGQLIESLERIEGRLRTGVISDALIVRAMRERDRAFKLSELIRMFQGSDGQTQFLLWRDRTEMSDEELERLQDCEAAIQNLEEIDSGNPVQLAGQIRNTIDCLHDWIVHKSVVGKGMKWQEAQKKAEEHVTAHGGHFPNVKRLAKAVGCSRPTMDKAIEKSVYLKARKAEAAAKPGGAREVPLTDATLECSRQTSETEPELAELIAEQEADKARDERQSAAAQRKRH